MKQDHGDHSEGIIEEEDENSVSSGTSDGVHTGHAKRYSKKKSTAVGFEKKKTKRISEINRGGLKVPKKESASGITFNK